MKAVRIKAIPRGRRVEWRVMQRGNRLRVSDSVRGAILPKGGAVPFDLRRARFASGCFWICSGQSKNILVFVRELPYP